MRKIGAWISINLSLACCVATAAFGSPVSEVASDCRSQKWMTVDRAHEAFSRRSVEIIRLAQRSDLGKLAELVFPSAQFTVWEGDAGIGERVGPAGAVDFARNIGATDFAFATIFPGPVLTDVCHTQTVTVWLSTDDGKPPHIADFKYSKGRLLKAEARRGAIFGGKIGPN